MNKNILANMAGRFWSTLSNFIFIPIYIGILGLDNYAVIAFALIISSVLVILDLGLSVSVAREMSRSDISNQDKFNVFRNLEAIYLLICIACAVLGITLSEQITSNFINQVPISDNKVNLCLKIITAEAGMQIFFRFYVSALMGMERQVQANLFNIGWGVVRNGLVIAVIYAMPDLIAFFLWQAASTILVLLWAKLHLKGLLRPWRPGFTPFIDWAGLKRIRSFTGGVFLISFISVVNTQLDRLILSYRLELKVLGYYTLAVSIGSGMLALSSPFVAAIQPRLTRWFSDNRDHEAQQLYLRATTLVAVLIFPAMAVVSLNPGTTLLAWTGDPAIAAQASAIVPWVVSAYAFLALSSMTYSVALANGFTRYNNFIGLCTLLVSVPGYWLMIGSFGAVGAAILFLGIQFAVSTSFHILVDRRFLRLGLIRTYLQFFICPAIFALAAGTLLQVGIQPPQHSRLLMFAYLGLSYLLVAGFTATLIAAIFYRPWLISIRRYRSWRTVGGG